MFWFTKSTTTAAMLSELSLTCAAKAETRQDFKEKGQHVGFVSRLKVVVCGMFIIWVITSCSSLHKDVCYFVNRSNLYPKPSLNMKTTRQGEEDDLCDVQHLSIYYLNIWCKFNLYSLRLKIDKLVPTFLQHPKIYFLYFLIKD